MNRRGFFGAVAAAAVAPSVSRSAPRLWVDVDLESLSKEMSSYVFRRGDFTGDESNHVLDADLYLLRAPIR